MARAQHVLLHGFLNVIFNNFSEIYSSKLVPPIWCHLLGSWIQEAVISGYIKKRTLGAVGRGSGRVTRCAYESSFYV